MSKNINKILSIFEGLEIFKFPDELFELKESNSNIKTDLKITSIYTLKNKYLVPIWRLNSVVSKYIEIDACDNEKLHKVIFSIDSGISEKDNLNILQMIVSEFHQILGKDSSQKGAIDINEQKTINENKHFNRYWERKKNDSEISISVDFNILEGITIRFVLI